MKIYKVSLEPLDWFFFGGESTFDNSVKQSYIAHSNTFPQQTALLGMIRYQLLKQKGLLFEKNKPICYDKVNELIGNESFMMGVDEQTFGAIDALSPVFLEKKVNSSDKVYDFFPLPYDYNYTVTFESTVKVNMNGLTKLSLINIIGDFNPKTFDNYSFYKDSEGNVLKSDDIFAKRIQIGIMKNTDADNTNDMEDGFYKREMIKFKNGNNQTFCFAFYLSIDNNMIELKNDFVYLGAERSCFKMSVKPIEKEDGVGLTQLYLQNHSNVVDRQKNAIVLLSPTYVNDIRKLNNLCRFHWSCQMPFRNITRAVDGKLNSGDVSYARKDICYQMLCPGSVLFFDDEKRNEIELLLNDRHLQSIGYNYFNTMKNNKNN